MSVKIHKFADVDPRAELGMHVEIGPFCSVGPRVSIGDETVLQSHVAVIGTTTIGKGNRLFPCCVIGGEPQDVSFTDTGTQLIIGDNNLFREGFTANIGAEKEDHITRIGNNNMFMANSHIAHNCDIHNNIILVNGVLIGGHVHIHDGAIISGNSVVHHFSTIGTLAFVSGGCRVPHDIPPYMLAAGSDNPAIRTINIVGMRRAGIPDMAIRLVKKTHRMLFREHKKIGEVRALLQAETQHLLPAEVEHLLDAVERQSKGKMGRAREAVRNIKIAPAEQAAERRAA